MDDLTVESKIQEKGLNAPRMTPDDIDNTIAKVEYHVFPGTTLTICCLTLNNGFTVTGESACASPDNFDAEIGQKVAYQNAKQKIWSLEGYRLKQELQNQQEKIERIAKVAHEINAAYCLALGDDSQVSWHDAPEWQKDSAIKGVELHMRHPEAEASHSHESWFADKVADDWVYGEVKDPERKTHPCMVAFNELPVEQQAKDFLFRQVVHSLL